MAHMFFLVAHLCIDSPVPHEVFIQRGLQAGKDVSKGLLNAIPHSNIHVCLKKVHVCHKKNQPNLN